MVGVVDVLQDYRVWRNRESGVSDRQRSIFIFSYIEYTCVGIRGCGEVFFMG